MTVSSFDGHEPIASLVRRSLGDLSVSERKVARALLAAYPIAGLETVGQLAARARVSGPTVMRFVSRLGYNGFLDFQQVLLREVQERLTSSLALMERKPAEPEETVLSRSLATFVGELNATFDALPPAEFEAVVGLLSDERRAVLGTGGRFSGILASYLVAHLTMLRPGCRCVPDSAAPGFDELIDVGRRTTVVVFDYRRYQNSTIEFARRAGGRGATIVLFTDPWLSPIAEFARHVLVSTMGTPSAFESQVAATATVEAVIAGVAAQLGDAVRPRLEELERLRAGTTWELPAEEGRDHADHAPG
jgi:DNA-binding MurR/RpiR family transcriptional regulator